MTRLLSALVVMGGMAFPVSAQLSVQVVDSFGQPVPAVRIELYGRGELIAVVSSDAAGVAALTTERWPDVRRLSLSHLGFNTLIVQADEIPADGLIRLEPRATELEGLTVEASDLCPVQDSPEARGLWSGVASLYSRETSERASSARFSRYREQVSAANLHREVDSHATRFVLGVGAGVLRGEDLTYLSLDDRILEEGYAWPPAFIGGTSGPLAWQYPAFDHTEAHHFASPVFGALHDFEVLRESSGEVTLAFCANGEGRGATIDGVITLIPGEALVSAQWLFQTEDPDEEVGGVVTFVSHSQGRELKPHLMSGRGVVYRPIGNGGPYANLRTTFSRRVTVTDAWYLHASPGHPCKPGDGRGLTRHSDPPTSPDGIAFTECVVHNWGRQ